jgi:hypothetical protein
VPKCKGDLITGLLLAFKCKGDLITGLLLAFKCKGDLITGLLLAFEASGGYRERERERAFIQEGNHYTGIRGVRRV